MVFERIVNFFMPNKMRHHPDHPDYAEFRVVVSACLIGLPLVLLFPIVLYQTGKSVIGYIANGAFVTITLLCIRLFGHYRIPMTITALATYFIIYGWIKETGYIYSSNMSLLHMYLLSAIWADKRFGWWAIFTNLFVFGIIYQQTLATGISPHLSHLLGTPIYALMMHVLITLFFGGFLAYLQFDQERDRKKIKDLQEQKIGMLDKAVKKRTEQLNTMRENIATDFHDETGNMLSAITRQAAMLRQSLPQNHPSKPLVDTIIKNSNALYASSKDFLWHLHHDGDDPTALFNYLTSYGQLYYNQFDIAFSSTTNACPPVQFAPSAAINLIYIFKEAMTNVVKHANAHEVTLEMHYNDGLIYYRLLDDGLWKQINDREQHYGLRNIEKRCQKNNFKFDIAKSEQGTCLTVTVLTLTDQ